MLESLTFFCIFGFDKAGDKEVKKKSDEWRVCPFKGRIPANCTM